jgi:signal transduction histidine kinase
LSSPKGQVLTRFCLVFLWLLFLSVSPALAQSDGKVYVSLESLQDVEAIGAFERGERYFGIGNWRYHAGDDPAWSDPGFDDGSWEVADTRLMASDLPKNGWDGIGWFRLRLEVATGIRNRSMALLYRQVGAAEIYLDGKIVHCLGTVGASGQEEEILLMLAPPPLFLSFDDRKTHVLAVRYSNFEANSAHRYGFPAGFWMLLRDGDESVAYYKAYLRKWSGVQMFFVGVPLAFALLHLLLFFFHRPARANLYYAAVTGVASALTYFAFQLAYTSSTDQYLLHFFFFKLTVLALLVSALRFLYAVFYPVIPRQFWFVAAVGMILAALAWILRESYILVFGLLLLVEMLRVVIAAIVRKRDGSWIIGIGFLIFCLAIAYQLLMGLGITKQPEGVFEFVYVYGISGLLVSMSVYLARDFARINKSLERTNLELEDYSRTLEEKVYRRTQEVTKKNAELEDTLGELRDTQAQLIQSEKMASLGRLVAGVTHELNTPVGAIKSTQDNLARAVTKLKHALGSSFPREYKDSETVRSAFSVIMDANQVLASGTERVAGIVGSLRNFARLDEAEFQLADLHEGIESTLTLLGVLIRNDIAVVKEYGDISAVYCSPAELNQAFMHVIRNAAQSIKGEGEIRIRTYEEERHVFVQVADTGVGISPEELRHIFDFGLGATDSRVKMKLGLSTTYNIIQAHNGEINIHSEVGKGTEVTIVLPIRPS